MAPGDKDEDKEFAIDQAAPAKSWNAGQQVGRYTLMAKIAVGGMAEIWIARQAGMKGFEKVVAIKKILDSYYADEGFVEMFLDEARIAAQLNHPNIVQIYDLGEDDGSYYIAMEYLAGETLARIARSGGKAQKMIPVSYVARIIASAAEGLAHAHAKVGMDGKPLNVVHRDVSPHNLILTYDGITKVVDFGIARAANRSSQTEAGKFKGKIAYMAPEQAKLEPLDGSTDIFALGIVLYEAIAHTRLFKYEDPIAGLKAISSDEPIPSPRTHNPDIPEDLAAITLKALERNPANRYQTAREFQTALEQWLRTQPEAPGTTQLAAYMHDLFAERMASQTKLIEAARAGDTGVSKIGTGPSNSGEFSMPGSGSLGGQSRRNKWVAGGVAGMLLAVGMIALVLKPSAAVQVPTLTELAIESEPTGAIVSLDGKVLGPAPVRAEVTLGEHRIGAALPDFEPFTRIAKVERAGERTNMVLTLQPVAVVVAPPAVVDAGAATPAVVRTPAVARGKLSLSTTPWTTVFLGTRKLGTTPLFEVPLPVGRHVLKLVNPDKKIDKTLTVEIKAGQTTALKQKL